MPVALGHPAGDARVVRRGVGEGLALQAPPRLGRRCRSRAQLLEDRVVVVGVDHHRDRGGVLGAGADHRRPADVDVLEDLLLAGALGDRLAEGVEVHRQHRDGHDAAGLHLGPVRGQRRAPEQAAVDPRVERLHPAAEDLGASGVLGDLPRREARPSLRAWRVPPVLRSWNPRSTRPAGEGNESALVGDAEEGDHGSWGMDWRAPGRNTARPPSVNERAWLARLGGSTPTPDLAQVDPRLRSRSVFSPRWPRAAWPARASPPGGCARG